MTETVREKLVRWAKFSEEDGAGSALSIAVDETAPRPLVVDDDESRYLFEVLAEELAREQTALLMYDPASCKCYCGYCGASYNGMAAFSFCPDCGSELDDGEFELSDGSKVCVGNVVWDAEDWTLEGSARVVSYDRESMCATLDRGDSKFTLPSSRLVGRGPSMGEALKRVLDRMHDCGGKSNEKIDMAFGRIVETLDRRGL